MTNNEVISGLKNLLQLDYDAVQAYDKVILRIDDPQIRGQITSFRDDHRRHVSDLDAMIIEMGGKRWEPSRDLQGVVLESMAALRSITGTVGALKANEMAEKHTNTRYAEASKRDFPPNVLALITRNYEDERRHLAYIQKTLAALA